MRENSQGSGNNINSRFFPGLKGIFSFKNVFTVRSTIIMGMLIAVSAVLERLSVYIGDISAGGGIKIISLSYLPGVVAAMLFGPWAAIVYGFACDFVTFLAGSSGYGYYFGYAISAMAGYFIYACFLYNQKPKLWKVALARFLVVIVVIFGLNYIWSSQLYGATPASYYASARFISNLINYPLHVALIYLIGKYSDMFKAAAFVGKKNT